jgi:hypothetical protein
VDGQILAQCDGRHSESTISIAAVISTPPAVAASTDSYAVVFVSCTNI